MLDPAVNAMSSASRRAKIEYRLSENSRRLVAFHQARAQESLLAAGARETVVAPFIRATGWHLLGTAMMGDDPATSVVDAAGPHARRAEPVRLRRQRVADLPGMNPTATIAALALRFTEQLIASRARAEGGGMTWSDQRRAQLGAIADELIPAGWGMPSASEAGVGGRYLSMPRSRISSTTSLETRAPNVSKTACAQGFIFSDSLPGR